MVIYLARNKRNGLIYIGKSEDGLKRRLNAYKTEIKKPTRYFARALAKYGIDGFEWSIIDTALNAHELIKKEEFWINEYKSNKIEIGYNLRKANISPPNKKIFCFELKRIFNSISEAASLLKIGRSAIHRNLIGKTQTCKDMHWKYCEPNFDINNPANKLYDNYRKPISKRSKPVICIERDIQYPNIKIAAKEMKTFASCIVRAIDTSIAANGFHWKYAQNNRKEIHNKKYKRSIVCVEDNIIYTSQINAAKAYNLAPISIMRSCENNKKNLKINKHFRYITKEEERLYSVNSNDHNLTNNSQISITT